MQMINLTEHLLALLSSQVGHVLHHPVPKEAYSIPTPHPQQEESLADSKWVDLKLYLSPDLQMAALWSHDYSRVGRKVKAEWKVYGLHKNVRFPISRKTAVWYQAADYMNDWIDELNLEGVYVICTYT